LTLVTVLCLNHGKNFGITWTSDSIGEQRINVCRTAFHRYFHYYGGLKKPYPYAWLYRRNDFSAIQKRVNFENEDFWLQESDSKLKEFFQIWEYIVNENFMPEFFLYPAQKEKGMNYENLPKLFSRKNIKLDTILSNLKLDTEPFEGENSFDENENSFDFFSREVKIIQERRNACIACQSLDRKSEIDFFDGITDLQKTPILEQHWLSLHALHFFIRKQVKNQEEFMKIIWKNLLSDYYLLRKETFEIIKTIFLVQPDLGLRILNSLLNDKNINLKLFGVQLLKQVQNFFLYLEEDKIYLENPFRIKLNKSFQMTLLPLFELAFDFQYTLFDHLERKNAYWNEMNYFSKEKVLEKTTKSNSLEKISIYNHSIRLPELRVPFREFYQ